MPKNAINTSHHNQLYRHLEECWIYLELDYLKPEGGLEVASPEIKVEPKTPPKIIQKPMVEQKKEKKKITVKPVTKPKPSVKELFKLEPKPKPVNIKPAKDKSTHELFEDLF